MYKMFLFMKHYCWINAEPKAIDSCALTNLIGGKGVD